MTTSRRTSPIPQLKCIGGDACRDVDIEAVQCLNRGFDGRDVQWECKAELEDLYKFGRIEVLCEGYAYPDDPFILAGSCGLEYTLYYTEKGKEFKRQRQQKNQQGNSNNGYQKQDDSSYYGSYYDEYSSSSTGTSFVSKLVYMAVAGILLYSMWEGCMNCIAVRNGRPSGSRSSSSNSGNPGNGGGGGGGGSWWGGNGGGSGGNNWGSGPSNPGCNPDGTPLNSTRSSSSTGNGFWSGLTMGALAASLFNRPRYGNGYGYGGG
ncbi:Store-operated calcium entry-associated regulatory factor, partial [Blyttiomyces sp. JEL0837]